MICNTLYVSDLDGTLLNSHDTISKYSLSVLNRLIEQGMKFTYATARSLISASKVTAGLSLHIPVIVYNGAFIMEADTGRILHSASFTENEQQYVADLLHNEGLFPFVYTFRNQEEKVLWYPHSENEGMKRYLSLRQGDKRFEPVEPKDSIYQGDMFYFTCIGEKEELQSVYNLVSADARYRCTLQQELYRPEYWLEIMPAGASKACAIKALKGIWSCNEIISFGDAVNDIPMFQISDEAYAVANAVPELNEYATGVILSNEQDGVARWMETNIKWRFNNESSL